MLLVSSSRLVGLNSPYHIYISKIKGQLKK